MSRVVLPLNPQEGDAFWLNGDTHTNCHINYKPSWSKSKPWCPYANGTAYPCRATFAEAARDMGHWFGKFKKLPADDDDQIQSDKVE